MSKFNMSGEEVTLDLESLEEILSAATAIFHESLENKIRETREEIIAAYIEKSKKNEHEHYRKLCRANTAKTDILRISQNYAKAIESLFHVAEARKRNIIKFERDTK